VLLANDYGPMHVAAAVGTPVVAISGPTSPARTGPYGKGHRVLANQIPCSPCFSRTCRNSIQLECLTSITAEEAIEAVRDQLKKVKVKAKVEAQARSPLKIFTQP